MESETDELVDLLDRIANGDRKAFADLYQRTCQQVYGMVRRMVSDATLCEELTQEIFLTVWRDAARFRPEDGCPLAWLMTIAHRQAVDRVRAEHSNAGQPDAGQPNTGQVHHWQSPRAAGTHGGAGSLTSRQTQVIDMAFYGGMTYGEVAECLKTPVASVKAGISDGLRKLRRDRG